MKPDNPLPRHARRNKGIVTKYSRDIEKCTKVITQKLDKVHAFAKEHGFAEEGFCEEPHNNNDGYFIDLSNDVWNNVYPGRGKWMTFAREWSNAYYNRAVLYMERAGTHSDSWRWCRRCTPVRHSRGNWDYEAEINAYTGAIEDYMNTIRLQWGCHYGINSYGDAFAEVVRNYVYSSTRHFEPIESQSIIRLKSVQKQNSCICNLFSNYESCHPDYLNRYGRLKIPTFLRYTSQTDIVITLQSAYLCKAEACFEAKRYECAVEEYTKLIRLSPEESHISAWVYPLVYTGRARALLCSGRNDEAEADFEEALRIDPGVKEVKSSLFRLPEMSGG